MGRNLSPKCKQCRRLGEKLLLKGERCTSAKCAILKRNYAPGIHGPKGKKRGSDYGAQLAEKQKAKKMYHLMESQFRLTFDKAKNQTGDTGYNFLKLLEMRLDNTICRLGWATSHSQARQLVNHGHFTVNGRKVDIPSFNVKTGDIIKIKKTSVKSKFFRDLTERLKNVNLPSWVNFNAEDLSAKVLHEPKKDDMPQHINVQMIIEFYSK
ncbi:MAG TPA: 30S ribosomal protein S4 [bacterium]|nr:30S ribosomal protein S4 [bacterium]HPT29957.1 30S ribosomal protein S4 [bacterium]